MKKIITIVLCLFCAQIFCADAKNILEIVNEELTEVLRLSKQMQHKNPELTLRLAELTLEKARLTKQIEFNEYIALTPEQKSVKVKQDFFKNSKELYKKATSICIATAKKFPKYQNSAEVQYIIGQNFAEQKDFKNARKYLEKSVSVSKKNTQIFVNSRLALAEIEYNNKSYDKAYKLYQNAFNESNAREDRWWTKEASMMAWCAYKLNKNPTAIKIMEEVIEKSKSGKFIDVSNTAKRDLALFSAEAGDTERALELLGNNSGALIKLAEHLRTKGKMKEASAILKNIETSGEQDNYSLLSLLESYQGNEDFPSHLKVCEKIFELDKTGKLTKDEREIFQGQLQWAGSSLQRKNKPELVERYFSMLGSYKSKPQGKLNLLIGESYAKNKNPNKAHEYYNKAFENFLSNKDSASMQQSLDLIFLALADKKYKGESKDADLQSAYQKAITYFPRSEKTRKIYEKNFRIALDLKKPEDAEKIIHTFNSTWPKEKITTEAMIAEIVDYQIKNKNLPEAQKWSKLINENPDYKIGLRVTSQIRKKILAIQIDDRSNSKDPSKNIEALKAYVELYNVESATHLEKFEAALNISILLHKLSKAKHLSKWAGKALTHAKKEDVESRITEFLNFSILLYDMQYFAEAESLSKAISVKLCNSTNKKKDHFFSNTFNLGLINSHFDEAIETTKMALKCGIPKKSVNELTKSFLNGLVINQQWKPLQKYLPEFEKESNIIPDSIWYHELLLKKLSLNDSEVIKKQLEIFNDAKRMKIELSIDSLDTIASHQFTKVETLVNENNKITLSFPEKVFNTTIEKKFGNIQKIIESVLKLRPLGTPKSVLYGYRVIITSILSLKNEISDFKPENVSETFLASFKKGMQDLINQLEDQKIKYANEAMKTINKEKLLSEDALWLNQIAKNDFPIMYYYSKEPLLMDRQGSSK
jgi:tetratricopeptide (TPR) repeat protein